MDMGMGMGGASACNSESLFQAQSNHPSMAVFTPIQLMSLRFLHIPFPHPLHLYLAPHPPSRSVSCLALEANIPVATSLRSFTRADPSLNVVELVHRRYLFPLINLAQQHQSQIRRISHWRILPRHRDRGVEEVSKGLRSTNRQASYGETCAYEWQRGWWIDSGYWTRRKGGWS